MSGKPTSGGSHFLGIAKKLFELYQATFLRTFFLPEKKWKKEMFEKKEQIYSKTKKAHSQTVRMGFLFENQQTMNVE